MPHRILILASGAGTLAQSIIEAEELDIEIVAVISDQKSLRWPLLRLQRRRASLCRCHDAVSQAHKDPQLPMAQ